MDLDQHSNTLYDLDIKFPPLSRTVAEVSNILASSGAPDTDQLIHIVNQDPLVVASVLKRINSAYYGMKRKFDDLRKAVVMIGFIEVSNIVLTSSYVGFRKLGRTRQEINAIDRIMRASIGAGYITNLLVHKFDIADKSTAFTVGLMHNIGRLVLLYNQPSEYTVLVESSDDFLPAAQMERDMLGMDHLRMGAIATQHWNFPDLLPRLIESFNTPGHLSSHDERNLGLAIKASVDYTHYLLMAICQYPDWNKKEDETEEDTDSIFPLSITPPSSLYQLCAHMNKPQDLLTNELIGKQEEVLLYIESMVKP